MKSITDNLENTESILDASELTIADRLEEHANGLDNCLYELISARDTAVGEEKKRLRKVTKLLDSAIDAIDNAREVCDGNYEDR